VYFVACWSRGGRTLAMQTWKMRVVRRDGASVSAGRAARRQVARGTCARAGCIPGFARNHPHARRPGRKAGWSVSPR